MSDTSLATIDQPQQPLSRHQIAARDRSKPMQVTGRLKRALDHMVWDNLTDCQAAVAVNLNVLSIRKSLQRPHVLGYYKTAREVLRSRESPRNIHTLIEVRDQTSNQMARVNAVKALEQLDDAPGIGAGALRAAGIVIMVGAAQPVAVQHAVLERHAVGNDDKGE